MDVGAKSRGFGAFVPFDIDGAFEFGVVRG